ncbi:MAG: hypothetical protein M3Z54_05645 [Gemmatimonadota bacterium]|nr:hypothetical protein [Gemmatimonadota bacterium]
MKNTSSLAEILGVDSGVDQSYRHISKRVTSVNTARRHAEHVLSKLDVHSRAAAISRLDGN